MSMSPGGCGKRAPATQLAECVCAICHAVTSPTCESSEGARTAGGGGRTDPRDSCGRIARLPRQGASTRPEAPPEAPPEGQLGSHHTYLPARPATIVACRVSLHEDALCLCSICCMPALASVRFPASAAGVRNAEASVAGPQSARVFVVAAAAEAAAAMRSCAARAAASCREAVQAEQPP